jgi:hypothetical protein
LSLENEVRKLFTGTQRLAPRGALRHCAAEPAPRCTT